MIFNGTQFTCSSATLDLRIFEEYCTRLFTLVQISLKILTWSRPLLTTTVEMSALIDMPSFDLSEFEPKHDSY